MDNIPDRDRVIVALDVPTVGEAETIIDRIGDAANFFKIGYQLAPIGGFDLAQRLTASGKKVFLDLKYHDIGATVEKGVRSVCALGTDFLTVHAEDHVMAAAVAGRDDDPRLKIMAVTVLTSLSQADIDASGYSIKLEDLVLKRARRAVELGVDGVIASPQEAARIRAEVGDALLIATPGVRPLGASLDDQKRVATPSDARAAGANYVVVGRPITKADDPHAATQEIVAAMAKTA
ncbi:MAG: orotidine-5'-phosphate decarboxylase [Pseudomonadota bacterium]